MFSWSGDRQQDADGQGEGDGEGAEDRVEILVGHKGLSFYSFKPAAGFSRAGSSPTVLQALECYIALSELRPFRRWSPNLEKVRMAAPGWWKLEKGFAGIGVMSSRQWVCWRRLFGIGASRSLGGAGLAR